MLAALSHKTVIEVSGADTRPFLQSLITQDVERVDDKNAVYSALLSPQGKMIADFFIIGQDPLKILIDKDNAQELTTRLNMYKLRSRVDIVHRDARIAHATAPVQGGQNDWIIFPDPRLEDSGWWVILPEDAAPDNLTTTLGEFDRHRHALGLTDGIRDWVFNKTLPLEIWADKTNGVDFKKGCYVGQEVTARTHYRNAIKKRLVLVTSLDETPLPHHSRVFAGDIEIGTTLSTFKAAGLAMVNMKKWQNSNEATTVNSETNDIAISLKIPKYSQDDDT